MIPISPHLDDTAPAMAAQRPQRPPYLAWAAFQRRQVSMADLAGFECVFMPLAYKGRSHLLRAAHYLALMVRTWRWLHTHRPRCVWLQLPQLPLLWTVLAWRALFDRRLQVVADCHNSVFRPPWSTLPFTAGLLARADLVLVHNDRVLAQALALGLPADRTRVLEDLPALPPPPGQAPPVPAAFAGRARPWVLFAGSYGHDEPVAEVLQATRELGQGVVAITGRLGNAAKHGHDIHDVPGNAVLTDYLPLPQFEALLVHADVVLALTRLDGIQLSVCSEAIGYGKAMVASDTPLLRALFGRAAELVDSAQPSDIVRGIRAAMQRRQALEQAAVALATERLQRWVDEQWQTCRAVLDGSPR